MQMVGYIRFSSPRRVRGADHGLAGNNPMLPMIVVLGDDSSA